MVDAREPAAVSVDPVVVPWRWRRQLPFLLATVLVTALMYIAVARLNNWYEPPLSHYSDLNIRIPKALQRLDSRLYPDDPAVGPQARDSLIHRELFILWLSSAIERWGGFRVPLIIMSALLTLVFVVGIYLLAWYLAHDLLAAALAGVLATGNFQAWGGVALGFAPRQVVPRNFVVALTPWLLLALVQLRRKRSLWMLFAVLGLLTYLHLIAAFHLCLILLSSVLMTSESMRKGLREILVCGVVALVVASPAAWRFLPQAEGNAAVSEHIEERLAQRHWFELTVSRQQVKDMAAVLVPYGTVALLGVYQMQRAGRPAHRGGWRVCASAALAAYALPLLGLLANSVTLRLRVLSLLRVSRYFYFFCFVPVAVLLSAQMRQRRALGRAAAWLLLAGLMVLGAPEIASLLERQGVVESEPATTADWDWDGFSKVCEWVAADTPYDARFLVPPEWALFRVYAQRSPVADWKGGFNEYYWPVVECYSAPSTDCLADLVDLTGADYVVLPSTFDAGAEEPVFWNAHYQVVALP